MGADLVCQVIGKPDQVSFIWSAGKADAALRAYRNVQLMPSRIFINGADVPPEWLNALLMRTLNQEVRSAVNDPRPG